MRTQTGTHLNHLALRDNGVPFIVLQADQRPYGNIGRSRMGEGSAGPQRGSVERRGRPIWRGYASVPHRGNGVRSQLEKDTRAGTEGPRTKTTRGNAMRLFVEIPLIIPVDE